MHLVFRHAEPMSLYVPMGFTSGAHRRSWATRTKSPAHAECMYNIGEFGSNLPSVGACGISDWNFTGKKRVAESTLAVGV